MKSGWGRSGNLAIALVAALAIAGFANYFGHKYYTQWDWTSSGLYSLSDRTENLLGSLEQEVRIISFLGTVAAEGNEALPEIIAIFEKAESLNPEWITFEQLDPVRDPLRAETLLREFEIDARNAAIVIVESGERRREMRLDELVQLESAGGFGQARAAKALLAEDALAAAVLSVTRASKPVIRFASGHGERALGGQDDFGLSRFADTLRREDSELLLWDAVGQSAVPDGTDLLVIASPAQSWLPDEAQAVGRYLDAGGRVLFFADPVMQRGDPGVLVPTGLEDVLERHGVRLGNNLVIDPSRRVQFLGAENFLATQIGVHPITARMTGDSVLFSIARSVEAPPEGEGQRAAALAETSLEGWGETALDRLDAIERDEQDVPGPLTVAIALELAPNSAGDGEPGEPGRLVVIGDGDVASNFAFDSVTNRAFLLNTVSWLLDEERSLGIPPKDRQLATIVLSPGEGRAIALLVALALPLLAIVTGLGTWWRRRRS